MELCCSIFPPPYKGKDGVAYELQTWDHKMSRQCTLMRIDTGHLGVHAIVSSDSYYSEILPPSIQLCQQPATLQLVSKDSLWFLQLHACFMMQACMV